MHNFYTEYLVVVVDGTQFIFISDYMRGERVYSLVLLFSRQHFDDVSHQNFPVVTKLCANPLEAFNEETIINAICDAVVHIALVQVV